MLEAIFLSLPAFKMCRPHSRIYSVVNKHHNFFLGKKQLIWFKRCHTNRRITHILWSCQWSVSGSQMCWMVLFGDLGARKQTNWAMGFEVVPAPHPHALLFCRTSGVVVGFYRSYLALLRLTILNIWYHQAVVQLGQLAWKTLWNVNVKEAECLPTSSEPLGCTTKHVQLCLASLSSTFAFELIRSDIIITLSEVLNEMKQQ